VFQSVGGYLSAETPVNEAPIVLLSLAIDCIQAAIACEI
jgi:hypothetical protein